MRQALRLGASLVALIATLCIAIPAVASTACHVNTIPDWTGSYTDNWLATAQVIMPPPQCPELVEYSFELAPRTTAGSVLFSIYQWGPTGPVGPALFTTTLPWGTTKSVMMVANINLTLTPGTLYGVYIDLLGYTGESVAFQQNQTGYRFGDGWWNNGNGWVEVTGTNHKFRAKWIKTGN